MSLLSIVQIKLIKIELDIDMIMKLIIIIELVTIINDININPSVCSFGIVNILRTPKLKITIEYNERKLKAEMLGCKSAIPLANIDGNEEKLIKLKIALKFLVSLNFGSS